MHVFLAFALKIINDAFYLEYYYFSVDMSKKQLRADLILHVLMFGVMGLDVFVKTAFSVYVI